MFQIHKGIMDSSFQTGNKPMLQRKNVVNSSVTIENMPNKTLIKILLDYLKCKFFYAKINLTDGFFLLRKKERILLYELTALEKQQPYLTRKFHLIIQGGHVRIFFKHLPKRLRVVISNIVHDFAYRLACLQLLFGCLDLYALHVFNNGIGS